MTEVTLQMRLKMRERPEKSVMMHQNWRDLLFMHWKYDAVLIQETLPEGLFVDMHEGNAYVGIIPFYLNDLSFPYMPPVMGFSRLLEVNLRTYVYDKNGVPGVFFYSLDLNSRLGVFIANNLFFLPYHYAELKAANNHSVISLNGHRVSNSSRMEFEYEGIGSCEEAVPGSLEFFLVERYLLFTRKNNEIIKGHIHHLPYKVSTAKVLKANHELFEVNHLMAPKVSADHVMYSQGVDVEFFKFEKDFHF